MSDQASTEHSAREWHHAPPHVFAHNTTYMITASTKGKARLFDTPEKIDALQSILFEELERYEWSAEAWSIFSNHYHLICRAPGNAQSLKNMIRKMHSRSAVWLNQRDKQPGRPVWFQYWDTCLTYEKSYLARLHYVHANPVKHGLVPVAERYPWCSMAWFLSRAPESFSKTVLSFKIDRVAVEDDY